MTLRNRFTNTAARFSRNADGTVAVMFAVSLAMLIGATGYAIDLSRTVSKKTTVQGVADAASLAAAKLNTDDASAMREIADTVFTEHLGPEGPKLIASVNKSGDAVTVSVQDDVPTVFAGFFGFDTMPYKVDSTSIFAEKQMDVALVLDTTHSMSGSKLASMKSAATGLVDELAAFDTDNVQLSVVPFSQHVNVGLSRRDVDWLDVPAAETRPTWEAVPGTERNCRQVTGTGSRDGVPYDYDYTKCDKDWVQGPDRTVEWQGCVGSRDYPLDIQPDYRGARIPGLVGKPCGSELQTLTSDMNTVRSSISGLKAQGETYMPAGLMWGWRSITKDAPLNNPGARKKAGKVVVMMTDGDNTKSKNGIGHFGTSKADADFKTQQICDTMKAEDVIIYTIAYEVDDASTRNLLRNCATDPSRHFDARNADALADAFKKVANSLRELRIAA